MITSFNRWGKCDSESLSNLPQVTQPKSDRAKIKRHTNWSKCHMFGIERHIPSKFSVHTSTPSPSPPTPRHTLRGRAVGWAGGFSIHLGCPNQAGFPAASHVLPACLQSLCNNPCLVHHCCSFSAFSNFSPNPLWWAMVYRVIYSLCSHLPRVLKKKRRIKLDGALQESVSSFQTLSVPSDASCCVLMAS